MKSIHLRIRMNRFLPGTFRIKEFPDNNFIFIIEGGKVVALKQTDPSGEYLTKKIK